MRYSNVLFVCVCTPQAREMGGRRGGFHGIGRHGRQRYQYKDPFKSGLLHDLGLSFIQHKASLLFNTLPRQTFSYKSTSILDKRDRHPYLAKTTSE